MKKYSNNSIKGYVMGHYMYEYGTQLPWQKEASTIYTVKTPPMEKEELAYWQAFFTKKYNGQFAKMH